MLFLRRIFKNVFLRVHVCFLAGRRKSGFRNAAFVKQPRIPTGRLSGPEFGKTIVFYSYFLIKPENFLNFTKISNKFGKFLNFLDVSKIFQDFHVFFFYYFKFS